MRNLSHDAVCKIVAALRHDSKLELIVSRLININGNDELLNFNQKNFFNQQNSTNLMKFYKTNYNNNNFYPQQVDNKKFMHLQNLNNYNVPHSQSLINGQLNHFLLSGNAEQNFLYNNRINQMHNEFNEKRAVSPLVLHRNFHQGYSLDLV